MNDLSGEDLNRVLSNSDLWIRIACISDAKLMEKILDGQLNVMVIFDHEFQRRFPKEWKIWYDKHS